ncbi:hypothetical protein MWN34_16630 [Ancylobacter sp. 6x-1]|uniref:Uncharacterized protein n=1 Tax=Ancylobacter crimeensis TaxID=2579147 RepID=A0ABT0DF10_9HYPH|nr:hypothetical protein [Ancylobacter crimeensis]MCK0198532.1 hypothetical protein [Ancylobacter crimeensis]
MLLFWKLNGLELANQDHPYYAEVFIGVVTGEVDSEALLSQLILVESRD